MTKGLNKGDTKQKPEEENPVVEKVNTKDTLRAAVSEGH